MRARLFPAAAVLAALVWLPAGPGANGRKFYDDDPIRQDPETQDAASVREREISDLYDFAENSFLGAGDRSDVPAVNVNTIDEVPDSSWFTNRIGREPWSAEQFARGPDTGSGPIGSVWTIVAAKTEGVQPGFTIRDGEGQLFFVKFDPPANPEMASGAEVITTKFFHAFGYHVPENYLATIRREGLAIGEGTQTVDRDGRRRPMQPRDVDMLLKRAARAADGSYRVLASRALEGKPVGPFRYHGTRPDDPNDIFPHEHRRELRGLGVFAAWLNHDDSRSANTLDTLVTRGDRTIVRHHLIDFGSALGSGSTQAQSTRAGNEYIWETRPTFITMLTLGLYVRPWIKVTYPDIPAVGRIEGDFFRPEEWKPEYSNPAFSNARPEDRFWAARIAAAVPEDGVRAIVDTARFTDPRATTYLTEVILTRQRKVLESWLNVTNPVVDPVLAASGELTFRNAAVDAGVASPADRYTIEWFAFDNLSGIHTAVGEAETLAALRAQAPAALLSPRPDHVAARIRAFHSGQSAWSHPLMVYFRRTGDSWSLVGLERNRPGEGAIAR